jgi:hypothetical protein
MFVLVWTYWNHPVAWFPRRRRGRQLEHGQQGGNFGFALMVFLLCFWALLGAATKFEDATAGRIPVCVLSVKGCKGVGRERDGGGEKVSMPMVVIGTLGLPQFFRCVMSNALFLRAKVLGGHAVICY